MCDNDEVWLEEDDIITEEAFADLPCKKPQPRAEKEETMTTSYDLSRKLNCTHSSLIPKIMHIEKIFGGEVMRFERKGDAFIEMNPVAAIFMLLLLENKNE